MLRSSTQLVKSHGDELGLEYLRNGDEYNSLENSLKAMEKKCRIWRTTRNLSPSACYRETNHQAGHYMLLRRAALLSQPENEKVYSLGHCVAVCSETTDWFMCVISEINDPSKEAKVRFMRKSEQYFLLSKKLEKWFPKSAIFHRSSIPSIDNRMRYPFDAIDSKGICDKIKTLDRDLR